MDTHKIPKRLSKAQIKEVLDNTPMEAILMGGMTSKQKTLTASQIKFAEEIAKGKTKAEAYRQSRPNGRKSNASPKVASNNGQQLMKSDAIQMQVEAFKVAIEAQKYQTPAHLRALVIHKLTEKVLNPDVGDSQQLTALKLLGQITEVGLFTERRETITISSSEVMKEKLMATMRLAMRSNGYVDVLDSSKADDLLAELTGVASENGDLVNPQGATPQFLTPEISATLHSIPRTETPQKNDDENSNITPVIYESIIESDTYKGGGGENPSDDDENNSTEKPPRTVWTEK
jgi:hypothetical protein